MYIEQAYKGQYDGWRYLVGLILIFVFWQFIGMIPLGVALAVKLMQTENIDMFSSLTDVSQMARLLGKNLFMFLFLISFTVGLLGIFISSKTIHKLPVLNLTTSKLKIDWKRFWLMFVAWGVFSSGMILLDYFYFSPEKYELTFQLKPFLILCVIAVLFIPLQTSFEEYLFRGYLMQGIGVLTKHKWIALLVTSVAFGVLHGANPEVKQMGNIMFVYYIGMGLFLGVLTLMDEGLELALGFHAANNLFIALLVTSNYSALQTEAILTDVTMPEKLAITEIIFPMLVFFPILLILFSKLYKWHSWKEKLTGKVENPISLEKAIAQNTTNQYDI